MKKKYLKCTVLIIVVLVFFNFYKLQEKTTKMAVPNSSITLSNNTIKQRISCTVDKTTEILFKVDTFARENQGKLYARLLDSKGNVVQKWELELSQIPNNDMLGFKLKSPLLKEKDYFFEIDVKAKDQENAVAIYVNNQEDDLDDYIILDGIINNKATSCFQMKYRTDSWFIFAVEIGLFVIGIFSFYLYKKKQFVLYKMCIVIGICFSYFILVPVTAVPDEWGHYLRSYEISLGDFVSGHNENGSGVSYLPGNIGLDLSQNVNDIEQSNVYYNEINLIENKVDNKSFFYYENYNICLYSPFSYIAQSLGVLLGRILTDRALIIFYMGRLTNVIFQLFLLYFCFKWLTEYSNLILVIVTMPMFLQEMVSYAADSTINILSLFYVAYLFKIKKEDDNLKLRQEIIIFALALLLALCKMVYFPLVLFVLCIPSNKFKNFRRETIFKITIVLSSFLSFLVWFSISMTYLQSEVKEGVNTPEQIRYVLTHLGRFILVCSNTTFSNIYSWITSLIGSQLGWLVLSVDGFIILLILFMLFFRMFFYTGESNNVTISTKDKFLAAFIILSVIALTYASLYVQWTPLRKNIIEGIQGRYFVPLLLPFALLINRKKVVINKNVLDIMEIMLIVVLQIMTVCSIYQFYV